VRIETHLQDTLHPTVDAVVGVAVLMTKVLARSNTALSIEH
jgi:hypothetical protein